MANSLECEAPPPTSAKVTKISDALVVRSCDGVEIVPPARSCCCVTKPQRARRKVQENAQREAPAIKAATAGEETSKLAAAVAETACDCCVSEGALHLLIAKLLTVSHPTQQWAALDGQQMCSVETIQRWRKERSKRRYLSAKLAAKEDSHSKLMSIRPSGVKAGEVKSYQVTTLHGGPHESFERGR